jgi:hypothetical protein
MDEPSPLVEFAGAGVNLEEPETEAAISLNRSLHGADLARSAGGECSTAPWQKT